MYFGPQNTYMIPILGALGDKESVQLFAWQQHTASSAWEKSYETSQLYRLDSPEVHDSYIYMGSRALLLVSHKDMDPT